MQLSVHARMHGSSDAFGFALCLVWATLVLDGPGVAGAIARWLLLCSCICLSWHAVTSLGF